MEELNKKLAEWAGFTKGYVGIRPAQLEVWLAPNQETPQTPREFYHGGSSYDLPNFTQSLDACFKWLMPKLNDIGEKVRMISQPRSGGAFFCAVGGEYLAHACVYAETPALALCRAIEKLIDGEK